MRREGGVDDSSRMSRVEHYCLLGWDVVSVMVWVMHGCAGDDDRQGSVLAAAGFNKIECY